MLTDHSKVAIAQIIFYVPAIILAAILLFHRHGRPRMPWIILQVFCFVRVACGIVVILYENKPTDAGLYIAALILLNAGLLPLIAATLGLLRIITHNDFAANKQFRKPMILSRVLLIVGIGLIIAGGSLTGNYTDVDSVNKGHQLTKAGYIVVAVFVATLIAFQGYFWALYSRLSSPSRKVLKGMGLAVPFIVVRIAWLFLSIYQPGDLRWNNLGGPIGPFVVMTAVMEYIVVCIYIGIGFAIPATKGVLKSTSDLEHEGRVERGQERNGWHTRLLSRERQ